MLSDNKIGNYLLLQNQPIGFGAYSTVFLAKNSNGRLVAIKKVKKSSKNNIAYLLARHEAKILYSLRSPYVCQLFGVHEEANYFYLIEKYYEGKTLAGLLKEKKQISSAQSLLIFKNLLKSIGYLLDKSIMHRDIKAENIIIYHDRTVLIDFGLATWFQKADKRKLHEKVGTIPYMSPELLLGEKYSTKSDIWSLGILLYQMTHGQTPFKGQSEREMLQQIKTTKSVKFSNQTTNQVKKLISRCLLVNPDERINWKDLFLWGKHSKLMRDSWQESSQPVNCCLFG